VCAAGGGGGQLWGCLKEGCLLLLVQHVLCPGCLFAWQCTCNLATCLQPEGTMCSQGGW
jgi:hypothetical protein